MELSLDAVIPTFNAGHHLYRCLRSIADMEGSESVNMLVIDGGSTDNTLEIAKEFNSRIIIKKGMYSNGINGARNFGLKIMRSNYYWQVDADNEFLEKDFLINIMEPFRRDECIKISVPIPEVIDNSKSFNNFLCRMDQAGIYEILGSGKDFGGYVVVSDLNYGLSNGSVINKFALDAIGGYDFDIRTLTRMRIRNMSKAAIVKGAHYRHYSTKGLLDYTRKMERRVMLISELLNEKDNFIMPIDHKDVSSLDTKTKSFTLTNTIRTSLYTLTRERNFIWVWGLLFPLSFFGPAAFHPLRSTRLLRSFLKVK